MLKDITMFDHMYEKNLEYFKEISLYIIAGEKKLEELREKVLPELQEKAKLSGEQLAPVKYPSISVINEALALYQMELKKPVHVVFCLDYSGSMYGDGFDELSEAMRQVLIGTENNIRFTDRDKIDVIAFSSNIIDIWSSSSGLSREDIYDYIESTPVDGATALYLAATKGLEILNKENSSEYIPSIILMTDGQANVGTMSSLRSYYKSIKKDIPIYSITFGNADEDELEEIAELTNGKVFDGKGNLAKAFKKVRGYN